MTFEELKDEVIAWDDAHLDLDVVTRDSIILEKLFEKCNIKGRKDNFFFYDDGAFVAHALFFRRRRVW